MVLRNHWVKTATFIILENLHSHKYNLLVHSTQTSLLTLNPTSQLLKCSGPFVACAFPGFINLSVYKRPWHVTVLTQVLLGHSIPLLRQNPSSQMYSQESTEMWIPQKSILLPLERNSHDYRTWSLPSRSHWELYPQPGIKASLLSCTAHRQPPRCLRVTGPQQGRNACFSHTAGQFALGIKITLLELLKQLPQLLPAALTSQYSRMGQSGVMLSFPMAPHICSHHPHTHLLSPMQQVLSGDGACPPSQQTQQDADSSLGPAGILALGLPHILQFSWPADDGDWHKPSYDLIVLPGCSIH